jgi:alkylation response protein AidB-like acyl-CoA dehydrogenase
MVKLLVDRNTPVKVSPSRKKLDIRSSNTVPIMFKDVRVPAEKMLGIERDGFKITKV